MDATLGNRIANRTTTVTARAPGTCGELMQGMLDGEDFLVNCPIDWYSQATLEQGAVNMPGKPLITVDQEFTKVQTALTLLGCRRQSSRAYRVQLSSSLPRGKGLASSTADLCAAIAAFAGQEGIDLSDTEIARLLCEVEPSDCTHFPGVARVNHLTGELLEFFGAPRRLHVLVVDCGGEVDTVSFDREHARAVYRQEQDLLRQALCMLQGGLVHGDNRMIARAATQSARISQQILPKPQFDALLACTLKHGALGVNCAHSGSVLGVLFEECDHAGGVSTCEILTEVINRHLGDSVEMLGCHRVISGGCHV